MTFRTPTERLKIKIDIISIDRILYLFFQLNRPQVTVHNVIRPYTHIITIPITSHNANDDNTILVLHAIYNSNNKSYNTTTRTEYDEMSSARGRTRILL